MPEEEKLSDVLTKYGVPKNNWPAGPKALNALRNLRLQAHLPAAFHYEGEEWPQIIAERGDENSDELHEALPDFKQLVIRLARNLGDRQYQDGEPVAEDFGELWINRRHTEPDQEAMSEWLANVLEDDERQNADKLVNIQAAVALRPSELEKFCNYRSKLLNRHVACSGQDPTTTMINISPAYSTVDIHHDEDVVASTVYLAKEPTSGQPGSSVAKIWIIWPRRHLHALANRTKSHSYSDTARSLKGGEGAVWFEQHDGESVVLPEDLPHATITVKRCYLIGSGFQGTFIPRAPLILADTSAGVAPSEAITRLVERTKAAFSQPSNLQDQFMHSFLHHLAYNVSALDLSSEGRDQLGRTLAEGWLNKSWCGLCKLLPGSARKVRNIEDGITHADGHLMNFSSFQGFQLSDTDRPATSNLDSTLPSPADSISERWGQASRRYQSSSMSQPEGRRSKRQRSS
ncbi:hypothetical protein KC343_g273 [Hortaea werneckii]|nr:hypothetical protein KC352_g3108 [Hortaea werneckii]KAI7572988.1 hypothetical protein KC317_g275 [Hortaea werneckii]KAI7628064.1 hypothetical protein KC346_g419 [Hortaea werneckii]KAI7638149.1 hypothetical protein KC343_g273 [Hortaea werneckii]KAI7683625.1 hypothetical protein KC319_g372 [Hortaea werneckii]